MGKVSTIEYVDSSVNPTMGCGGCELWNHDRKICFAARKTEQYAGRHKGFPDRFGEVKLFPGRMQAAALWGDLSGEPRKNKPWMDGRPRHIFVGDMGDLFDKRVPLSWIHDDVFYHVQKYFGKRHFWIFCTKRAQRMSDVCRLLNANGEDWPINALGMVSVTLPNTITRVKTLLNTNIPIKAVSFEPLIGEIDPGEVLSKELRWIVLGCMSPYPKNTFDFRWMRRIIDGARKMGIKIFIKQIPIEGHACTDWSQWPPELRIREMP